MRRSYSEAKDPPSWFAGFVLLTAAEQTEMATKRKIEEENAEEVEASTSREMDEPSTSEKQKRLVKFRREWLKTFDWIQPGRDEYSAQCRICFCRSFTIGHGGENDIVRHAKSKIHSDNVKAAGSSKKWSDLCHQKRPDSEHEVSVAEATFSYHCVYHGHSYNSAGCGSGLFKVMFGDSKIAAKFTCGKTKLSAIISNILAPHSKQLVLKALQNDHAYSVCTDASNTGSVKTFPLVVRYFDSAEGIKTGLLSFFSLESEDSLSIFKAIQNILETNGLSLKHIVAYGADNCNVNFGKNNSVFAELKAHNPHLVQAGCNLHKIHNAIKKACCHLKYDIEAIIIKIYNELSASTKRRGELKDILEWVDTEWCQLLRHVPTRWMSLLPALERLLQAFAPVKAYFLSQGTIPPMLKDFFQDELAEAYVGFIVNVCNDIQPFLTRLESEEVLILELHTVMHRIIETLREKKLQQFYGFLAHQLMSKCLNDRAVEKFKLDCQNFFDLAISSLDKWFDFKDEKLQAATLLNLKRIPRFEEILELVQVFNVNVNADLLFGEFINLKNFIEQLKTSNNTQALDQQWVGFFKTYSSPNLTKIVEHVFCIPHSNAAFERIFSLMKTWRKERNQLNIKNLESELMIKENFSMTCKEFQSYLESNNGAEIVKLIKQSSKYD